MITLFYFWIKSNNVDDKLRHPRGQDTRRCIESHFKNTLRAYEIENYDRLRDSKEQNKRKSV